MPLGYVVPALGRTGADLRASRGPHGLVATGPAARALVSLLPHLTTTRTTQTADGRPLEVRLPFLLALWLVLGCLTITDYVATLCVYEYMVGAERLGAALDALFTGGQLDTATASVGLFSYGGNTFLAGADGTNTTTFTLGEDFVINVTGFTGTLDASDFVFV